MQQAGCFANSADPVICQRPLASTVAPSKSYDGAPHPQAAWRNVYIQPDRQCFWGQRIGLPPSGPNMVAQQTVRASASYRNLLSSPLRVHHNGLRLRPTAALSCCLQLSAIIARLGCPGANWAVAGALPVAPVVKMRVQVPGWGGWSMCVSTRWQRAAVVSVSTRFSWHGKAGQEIAPIDPKKTLLARQYCGQALTCSPDLLRLLCVVVVGFGVVVIRIDDCCGHGHVGTLQGVLAG
ncbi:hypothetical protein COCMIDRAFT_25267 [Bipolaris oryzae ATCC 44560]|uniref:Uncharacterized protein n=1 Tax=Bipolaris oryzae ATCC 44560 TaxID=930090 RepID=W6ZH99_COCMI|nr:uncharacterized protein COCMIDRAFT_25267 [Bipolaris oryzae ATCC 44560]EUC46794.1 hypothetical protein COCMIDRAFT_25267 [Bipolaris oryzae ATCC 44560]